MRQRWCTALLVAVAAGVLWAICLPLPAVAVRAQQDSYPGFRVIGRHLYDRYGEKVTLYGVNKMVIYTDRDGLPSFTEIAKTGANVVRIVWLTEGSAQELDTAITNAVSHQLIPLVDCHDSTGKWEMLQPCVDYWVRPDVLEVLKKHEAYLLVNIANEAGNSSPPDTEYRAAYELAVRRMRAAGIHVPLIIDAASWGQSINSLQTNGPYLIQADPDHNLMFAIHMWWPKTGAQYVIDELQESVELDLPLIIGEFADLGPGCTCCIPYQTIIEQAHLNEIGYLAWSWGPGNADCASMDMTEDGTFDTLHGWGLEVAITSTHSIQALAVRPQWLQEMAPIPTATPEATPAPALMPEGLISQGKAIEATSFESDVLGAANAVDGDLNTRWSSAYADPQSLTIDLGESRDIARIVLKWEAAYGKAYKLQISDDQETWTDIISVSSGSGGDDDHLVSARGRYVRMLGLERGTEWGYSLWEFWIFDRPDTPLPISADSSPVVAPLDLRPDLVITDISWSPDPIVGSTATLFSATITNKGYSSTFYGTPVRVSFAISGTIVSWSETYTRSITSGESVVLSADNGPEGDPHWLPAQIRQFIVLAWVDDPSLSESMTGTVGSIAEASEFNNLLTAAGTTRLKAPDPTPTPRPTATLQPADEPTAPASTATSMPTAMPTEAPPEATPEPGPAQHSSLPLIIGGGSAALLAAGVGLWLRRRSR